MNDHNLNEKLSAYALGELSPEENAVIESALEKNEALRTELANIKETIGALEQHFVAEALPTLTEEQKEEIIKAAQKKRSLLLFPAKWTAGLSAVAAIFVAVLTLNPSFLPKEESILTEIQVHNPTLEDETTAGISGGMRAREKLEAVVAASTLSEGKYDDLGSLVAREEIIGQRQSGESKKRTLGGERQNFGFAEGNPHPVERQSVALQAPSVPAPTAKPQSVQTAPAKVALEKSRDIDGWRSEVDFEQTESLDALAVSLRSKSAATVDSHTLRYITDESEVTTAGSVVHRQLAKKNEEQMPSNRPQVEADNFSSLEVKSSFDSPVVMKGPYAARGGVPGDARLPEIRAKEAKLVGTTLGRKDLVEREFLKAGKDDQDSIGAFTASANGPSIEDYKEIVENEIKRVSDHPLSTFSIDVDTASYSNMRRFLKNGNRPPKDAVRIEELINYFNYDYAPPSDEVPFATHIESSVCPWKTNHRLVRIGLKGKVIAQDERPALNLVFLLDVSGSMNKPNKLGLVKKSMKALLGNLDERDRVAIAVYAGASGLVLPPTNCADKQAIIEALDRLKAGGSTNGGAGIDLAYKTVMQNYNKEGVNRVILCTDGDFNVGRTQTGDLIRDVETKAKEGIALSVLGFGMGNYKDETLEGLADKGNGNYAYIDTYSEARKVLVDQMTGTLVTIAKDVKIQVEFNPNQVAGYRLIGYENRMLAKEDFNDDKKDAGEIGAGHTVTALYEVIPAGQNINGKPAVDDLKYAETKPTPNHTGTAEMLTVKLRYKQPDSEVSSKIEFPFIDTDQGFEQASEDFRFATSVAGFGLLLRDSQYKGDLTFDHILNWSAEAQGDDEFGYRREFNELVRNAKSIIQ